MTDLDTSNWKRIDLSAEGFARLRKQDRERLKSVKPIETVWRGYRFRSRLEARWAVFFDALKLKWEYEPEGFELGDGIRYLPDFRVRYPGRWADEAHDVWFEVKADPTTLSQGDWEKLLRFEKQHGLIVLDGAPEPRMYLSVSEWLEGEKGVLEEIQKPYKPSQNSQDEQRYGSALWSGKGRLWWDHHEDFFRPTTYFGTGTEIEDAVFAARGARFEFGEAPK